METVSRLPRHPWLLEPSNSVLLVIDVQTVLLKAIWQKEKLVKNLGYLLEVAKIHELPTIVTEHNPKGLGPTDEEVKRVLMDTGIGYNPLEKDIFSCCGHQHVLDALKATGRNQIIVAGMETHICVSQTVLDLLHHGYQVHVVEDAVRARWKSSHKVGLRKMKQAGAILCDWEMVAYELTYGAKTETFKLLLALMKRVMEEKEKEKKEED